MVDVESQQAVVAATVESVEAVVSGENMQSLSQLVLKLQSELNDAKRDILNIHDRKQPLKHYQYYKVNCVSHYLYSTPLQATD